MYCTQCGKQIDERIICEDCLKKQQEEQEAHSQVDNENTQPVFDSNDQPSISPVGNKKAGLTKAIIGTVLSVLSVIFTYVALSFLGVLAEAISMDTITMEVYETFIVISNIFAILSLPCSIIGLIFGIKSIKVFRHEKSTTGTKPIATLILGIVSTLYSSIGLLLAFILLLSNVAF